MIKCQIIVLRCSTSRKDAFEDLFEEAFLITFIGEGSDFRLELSDQLGDFEWISL